ncbi:MAG: hypothetical protein IPG28_11250 [Betaproteobacteria bacterium]|nr:hypothetical protein [Betaproteobacteria bacterium]
MKKVAKKAAAKKAVKKVAKKAAAKKAVKKVAKKKAVKKVAKKAVKKVAKKVVKKVAKKKAAKKVAKKAAKKATTKRKVVDRRSCRQEGDHQAQGRAEEEEGRQEAIFPAQQVRPITEANRKQAGAAASPVFIGVRPAPPRPAGLTVAPGPDAAWVSAPVVFGLCGWRSP